MSSTAQTIWWVVGGCTLFHFMWSGALIGGLALLLRGLLPQEAFRARYRLGVMVLCILIALPSVLAWRIAGQIEHRLATPVVSGLEEVPETIVRVAADQTAIRSHTPVRPVLAAPSASVASVLAGVLGRSVLWLVPVWLLGAGLMTASLAAGLVRAARLRSEARPLSEGLPVAICRAAAARLGMRPVPVGVLGGIDSPILVGVVRPMVLLPTHSLSRWSSHEIEMVLMHELSHVRRCDNLVNLLQRLVESVLFFQPAVWFVSRWIRADREECCDQAVVHHAGRPLEYARILVDLAARRHPTGLAVAMGEHNLVGRVRRILDRADRRPRLLVRSILLAVVFLLGAPASMLLLNAGLVVPDQVTILVGEGVAALTPAPASPAPAAVPVQRAAEPLTPWWEGNAPGGATVIQLVDADGLPVAGAQLWIRPKWSAGPNCEGNKHKETGGPDMRPGENPSPLVSDSQGVIRITERKLLRPLKDCDPTVPTFIEHESRGIAAALNLSLADWGRTLTLSMQPMCRVRLKVACNESLPEGRRLTWTKAFIWIPGSSISYLLRQTGDASGEFQYWLPPGRYEVVTFAGSDDPNDACSLNLMETDTTVRPFEVPPNLPELDLGTIPLRLAHEAKPYGKSRVSAE